MSTIDDGAPLLTELADTGEVVEMFDVTGGRNLRFVDEMCRMQSENFSSYPGVPDRIRADAALSPQRHGLVVAQWFYTVNGEAASYQVADINLVRRTQTVVFGAVEKPFRKLTFGGTRLYQWATAVRRSLVARIITDGWLGTIAESSDSALPALLTSGWIPLPVDYQAPVHLASWRELGLQTERLTLIWLPPSGLSPEQAAKLQPSVHEAAAASFLLDLYGIDANIPWVAELCGNEVSRSRTSREPA